MPWRNDRVPVSVPSEPPTDKGLSCNAAQPDYWRLQQRHCAHYHYCLMFTKPVRTFTSRLFLPGHGQITSGYSDGHGLAAWEFDYDNATAASNAVVERWRGLKRALAAL